MTTEARSSVIIIVLLESFKTSKGVKCGDLAVTKISKMNYAPHAWAFYRSFIFQEILVGLDIKLHNGSQSDFDP